MYYRVLSKIIISFVALIVSIDALGNELNEMKVHKPAPIIIFVSFSMSDTSLKQWMRQAEIIHAPVVIRGLINNSLKDTIHKMAELTKDNHGGVQLDPTLFRRFQINQVPAVVVWDEKQCLPSQSCIDNFDVVYGNVTLDFALQKIVDQKGSLSMIANHGIEALRGHR